MQTLEQRVKVLEQKALTAVRYIAGGGAIAVARLVVGGGATIGQISKYTFNYAPGAFGPNVTSTQGFFVPGLQVNDWVFVNPPVGAGAAMTSAWVSAPNTLSITFVNPQTTNQSPPSGTYTVIAVRI